METGINESVEEAYRTNDLKEHLNNLVFQPKRYELVSVSYTAISKNPDDPLKVFTQESIDLMSQDLLRRINQYEVKGQLLSYDGLEGNKYFIMINHDNLSPSQWNFKPKGIPEGTFKKKK